jgi:hypothetical protein
MVEESNGSPIKQHMGDMLGRSEPRREVQTYAFPEHSNSIRERADIDVVCCVYFCMSPSL